MKRHRNYNRVSQTKFSARRKAMILLCNSRIYSARSFAPFRKNRRRIFWPVPFVRFSRSPGWNGIKWNKKKKEKKTREGRKCAREVKRKRSAIQRDSLISSVVRRVSVTDVHTDTSERLSSFGFVLFNLSARGGWKNRRYFSFFLCFFLSRSSTFDLSASRNVKTSVTKGKES